MQLNTGRDISASGNQVLWLKSTLAANTKALHPGIQAQTALGQYGRPEFQQTYSALVSGGVTS